MDSRSLALVSGTIADLVLFFLDLWTFWPAREEMPVWVLYGGASILGILGAVIIGWLIWRADTA